MTTLHRAAALAVLLTCSFAAHAAEPKHPNVLLLLADDQRHDTIHALGNDAIRTPNLDRLVKEGVACTHNFVTVPVCTPCRAELLSGRNSFRNGVRFFNEKFRPDLTLLPQAFGKAGYQTWFTGKWHNDSSPDKYGFQTTRRVFLGGMTDHKGMTFEEDSKKVIGFSSELFADAAIDFLTSKPKGPWLAEVAFTAPHDPRTPPDKFKEMYDPARMQLPPNFMPEHPFDNGEMANRDELLEKWPRTPDAVRRHLADYYGMISHMDEQIGRILKALEDSGQLDNTLIVFASDNGLAIGSHGLMGKQNLYDHSVRVPLVFRGPGLPKDKRVHALCETHDIYPTLCELAGVPVPETVEGLSLKPVLTGEKKEVRDAVFGAFRDVQRMARTTRWKLITYPQINKTQLFDLENDPHELRDLLAPWRLKAAKNPNFKPEADPAEVRKAADDLQARLAAWQKSVDDPLLKPKEER
jgi:arylsulfatase A-like enzyme